MGGGGQKQEAHKLKRKYYKIWASNRIKFNFIILAEDAISSAYI